MTARGLPVVLAALLAASGVDAADAQARFVINRSMEGVAIGMATDEVRERLGELSMPVHVIGAAHDMLVPVWKSEEIARLIPGSKLTILEDAPHLANVERAEDFNRAVLGFIGSATPAAA